MDLHPCRCGNLDFEPAHWLELNGEHLVARYEGTCPGCGTKRSFEFVLDPEIPPLPPAFGGDRPSQIIDPGQFLYVSQQLASAVPADPAELGPDEDLWEAKELLRTAIAALEEVLKFSRPGARGGVHLAGRMVDLPAGAGPVSAPPARGGAGRVPSHPPGVRRLARSLRGARCS